MAVVGDPQPLCATVRAHGDAVHLEQLEFDPALLPAGAVQPDEAGSVRGCRQDAAVLQHADAVMSPTSVWDVRQFELLPAVLAPAEEHGRVVRCSPADPQIVSCEGRSEGACAPSLTRRWATRRPSRSVTG